MSVGQPRGLLESLRGLAAHGVALLRNRLSLLAVELEEEKDRLLRLLLLGASAFVLISAGTIFLAVFLTVLLWDEHRLLVLGGLTVLFLGTGGVALVAAIAVAGRKSRLFSASLAELAEDQSTLEQKS